MGTGVFNGDYEIIQSLTIDKSVLVIGHNPHIPESKTTTPYVTWEYDKDKVSFYWGHYHKTLYEAQRDLVKRGIEKVRFFDKQKGYAKTHKERDAR